MSRFLLPLLLLATPAFAGEPVEGDPCASHAYGLGTGPAGVSLEEGALGRAQRACGRNEVGLGIGMHLSVHVSDFYADVAMLGQLDGSVALGDRGEVFASFEFLRYDIVFSAIASEHLGIGHTTLGGTGRFLVGKGYTLAATGKVVLPTATALYVNTKPFAFDVGLTGQFALHERIQLHAFATAMVGVGLGGGPANPRAGASVAVGPEFKLHPGIAMGFDLHGQFGYWEPLDYVAVAPTFRFSDAKRFGFEVSATVPFAGRERAQTTLWFRFSVRPGPVDMPPRPYDPADEKLMEIEAKQAAARAARKAQRETSKEQSTQD